MLLVKQALQVQLGQVVEKQVQQVRLGLEIKNIYIFNEIQHISMGVLQSITELNLSGQDPQEEMRLF